MRWAALLVALFAIVVGVMGIVSPANLTDIRRLYFATPAGLHAAGAVRLAMGFVVILAAPGSRWPKTLRVAGAVMCLQALSALVLGTGRAQAILEWEAVRDTALLRAGAAVSLATGALIAFALSGPRSPAQT